MKIYADTNFFSNLLLELPFSSEADRLAALLPQYSQEPLPVTPLLHMELVNALQRLIFDSLRGGKGIRVSHQAAFLAEARFELEMESLPQPRWRRISLREEVVFDAFHNLSHRHTASHGFRTYDVVHVATAMLLDCDTFWSFDTKARKLAALQGLKVN